MFKEELDKCVRKVKDYPKKGILFYDITSILMNPKVFSKCIEELCKISLETEPDAIIAVEARGFLFASPIAKQMEIPLLLARKIGKLPGETYVKNYNLEYGSDALSIHKEDLKPNKRYIIIDDLIATGGTLLAVRDLVLENGGIICGFAGVIGLPFLNYTKKLKPYEVKTLIEYQGE